MLTQIETEALRSQIRAHQAIRDHLTEIDWEQRRYEIARDAIAHMAEYESQLPEEAEYAAKVAVAYADELIKLLRQ